MVDEVREVQTGGAEVIVDAVDREEGEREAAVDHQGHYEEAASAPSKPTTVKHFADIGRQLSDEVVDEVVAQWAAGKGEDEASGCRQVLGAKEPVREVESVAQDIEVDVPEQGEFHQAERWRGECEGEEGARGVGEF